MLAVDDCLPCVAHTALIRVARSHSVDHTDASSNQFCSGCTVGWASKNTSAQGFSVPPVHLHYITLYTPGESRLPGSTHTYSDTGYTA